MVAAQFFSHIQFLRDLIAKSGALVLTFERDLLEKVIVTYPLLGYTNIKAFVGEPNTVYSRIPPDRAGG